MGEIRNTNGTLVVKSERKGHSEVLGGSCVLDSSGSI